MTEYIPEHFKRGVIVPIPKGTDKDYTLQDNYRGITLLLVLGKLYEKSAAAPGGSLASTVIDDLQGASQPKCSSLHTSLLLRETIAHNRERNSTVYVCLLDTRKAVDTVWTKGLLFKLLKDGVHTKLWIILRNHYDGFQCSVLSGGKPSEQFVVEQGVHQGAPFSMKL